MGKPVLLWILEHINDSKIMEHKANIDS